ncbi:hypothetical protein FHL15_007363 [Xylaria flabelliformis]|uniref:Uncharacterized protein n=1 Tax=Xylaria flabelliformis TaxID=2512241 RepID=A0A553HV28_9PEZI|nr:hypothetical protein FHL15_007363 [Xylaria flabelliformis]
MDADLQQVLDALVRAPRDVDEDIQYRFADVINIYNVNQFEMVNTLTYSVKNLCWRLEVRLALWYTNQVKEHRTVLSLLDELSIRGNTNGVNTKASVHKRGRSYSKFRLSLETIEEEPDEQRDGN